MSDTKRKETSEAPAGVTEVVRLDYGSNHERAAKVPGDAPPAAPDARMPRLPGGPLGSASLRHLGDQLLSLALLHLDRSHGPDPAILSVLTAHGAALCDHADQVAAAEARSRQGDGVAAARAVLEVCERLSTRLPAVAATLARVHGDAQLALVTALRLAVQQARVDLLTELELLRE